MAREKKLADMHRTLSGDGCRRTVVLHGLGGIGNTQLTVAYAKRYKDSYSAIFWLNINLRGGSALMAPFPLWLSADLGLHTDALEGFLSL